MGESLQPDPIANPYADDVSDFYGTKAAVWNEGAEAMRERCIAIVEQNHLRFRTNADVDRVLAELRGAVSPTTDPLTQPHAWRPATIPPPLTCDCGLSVDAPIHHAPPTTDPEQLAEHLGASFHAPVANEAEALKLYRERTSPESETT